MRPRLAVASVVLALCVIGAARGEEPTGGWWSRMFTMPWSKGENSKKKQVSKDEPPPGPSLRERQTKADADLQRRREVCLRLQEIALRLGDEEMARKAEQLDQQAWDAHVARVARIRESAAAPVEPVGTKKERQK